MTICYNFVNTANDCLWKLVFVKFQVKVIRQLVNVRQITTLNVVETLAAVGFIVDSKFLYIFYLLFTFLLTSCDICEYAIK